jgi:lysophospholipase L1-like esterase
MVKILVFGDSIVWGAFDLEKGGWVERLKTYFLKDYKEKGIGVYNFGISGDDTRGLLFRLEKQIKIIGKIEPEDYILLFSIGTNDFRYIDSKDNVVVPKEEFEENLRKIIAISKKYSNNIIFTGFPLIDESKTMPWNKNEYWEMESFEAYEDVLKKVCQEENIPVISLSNLLSKEDLYDGIHPNSQGHEKIFEKVKDKLK